MNININITVTITINLIIFILFWKLHPQFLEVMCSMESLRTGDLVIQNCQKSWDLIKP
jgi:hypothetical protein